MRGGSGQVLGAGNSIDTCLPLASGLSLFHRLRSLEKWQLLFGVAGRVKEQSNKGTKLCCNRLCKGAALRCRRRRGERAGSDTISSPSRLRVFVVPFNRLPGKCRRPRIITYPGLASGGIAGDWPRKGVGKVNEIVTFSVGSRSAVSIPREISSWPRACPWAG